MIYPPGLPEISPFVPTVNLHIRARVALTKTATFYPYIYLGRHDQRSLEVK